MICHHTVSEKRRAEPIALGLYWDGERLHCLRRFSACEDIVDRVVTAIVGVPHDSLKGILVRSHTFGVGNFFQRF